jgi:hypothetical protein
MTKLKTLGAVLIFSTAIATPVLAQGTTHHSRAFDRFRGTYNQFNGPLSAAPQTQERRNIEDFGFTGRDRSVPGGEDPSLNPSAS